MPKRSTLPVIKHGRNKQKHANKLKAQLSALGGVVSGNIKKARKPREVELPVLLASDKRCKAVRPKDLHSAWVDGTMTPLEVENLMSRIADKQEKAFSAL